MSDLVHRVVIDEPGTWGQPAGAVLGERGGLSTSLRDLDEARRMVEILREQFQCAARVESGRIVWGDPPEARWKVLVDGEDRWCSDEEEARIVARMAASRGCSTFVLRAAVGPWETV